MTENGWVYIVGAEHSNRVKIGYAANVKSRLAVLQNGNHLPLHLTYLKRGTSEDERDLLKRFDGLRVHGSWFRFEPGNELAEFVLESQKCPFHIIDIESTWGEDAD